MKKSKGLKVGHGGKKAGSMEGVVFHGKKPSGVKGAYKNSGLKYPGFSPKHGK